MKSLKEIQVDKKKMLRLKKSEVKTPLQKGGTPKGEITTQKNLRAFSS